ncbi:hypothetical protein F383_36508 [Gossypium arboreum]|uniref:Uncharacterized protein n=1 Tax=Gossypium arboreum TaxID=29729 RepID=A0A0B0NDW1_GOSAR|nr:hypothetical protein F383_36508 [Gossypium arboreum]
MPTSQIGSYS